MVTLRQRDDKKMVPQMLLRGLTMSTAIASVFISRRRFLPAALFFSPEGPVRAWLFFTFLPTYLRV